MKKSLLFCSTALALGVTANANAMDFGKKFYGKANATIGYSLQVIDGELKNELDEIKEYDYDVNKLTHGLTLGVGYNVYYKLNNFINPFVGLNIEGRIPLKTEIFYYNSGDGFFVNKYKFTDFLSVYARLGAKLKASKYVDVAPYYLLGFDVFKSEERYNDIALDTYPVENISDKKVGLSTGVGVDTILFNRYILGFEYKYSMTKVAMDHRDTKIKAESHQIGFKFGVQFL